MRALQANGPPLRDEAFDRRDQCIRPILGDEHERIIDERAPSIRERLLQSLAQREREASILGRPDEQHGLLDRGELACHSFV